MQAFQAGRWTRALVSQEDHEMGGGDLVSCKVRVFY